MVKQRRVTITIGEAVRCASMDCEASRPTAAMLVWVGEDGKTHKRVWPDQQLIEDGLFAALDRLPPGPTKKAGFVIG